MKHRCGTVAMVGRPNTGKSSLLNRLVGEKLSIVSAKAQTTRHLITGILSKDDCQYIFVDAPGRQAIGADGPAVPARQKEDRAEHYDGADDPSDG